ncbi:MAG: PspC domain-containing protein [Leucobacter sp.]
MNTSPDFDPSADAPGSAQGGPQQGSFFAWLRGLGIVRGSDRWFAGVAGGIAARAGIDPLIVRGIFVVLALLGGPGLLIYLIGWLLLPDFSGRIHLEDIFRGRASGGVLATAIVIACVVVIPALIGLVFTGLPVIGTPGFWGWDLWAFLGIPLWLTRTLAWLFWIAVLVVGVLWLRSIVLKRGRGAAADAEQSFADRSEGPEQPASDRASDRSQNLGERASEWGQSFGERASEWGRDFGEKAGRWGEDVGRQTDEWSKRYAEHYDAHRLGAAQTIITIACALLAAGLTVLWTLSSALPRSVDADIGEGQLPWTLAVIAATAVLAISLIIAGIRGRNTGWIGFLSACGVIVLLFTAILPWGTRFQPFGEVHIDAWNGPGAVVIAGNTHVDLRGLDDLDASRGSTGQRAETQQNEIEVWQLAGDSTVILPESHPTMVRVSVLAGGIKETSDLEDLPSMSGPFLSSTIAANLPSATNLDEAVETGRATSVTVYLLAGSAVVRHTDAIEQPAPDSEESSSDGSGGEESGSERSTNRGTGSDSNNNNVGGTTGLRQETNR